jgi:hypothetical protein
LSRYDSNLHQIIETASKDGLKILLLLGIDAHELIPTPFSKEYLYYKIFPQFFCVPNVDNDQQSETIISRKLNVVDHLIGGVSLIPMKSEQQFKVMIETYFGMLVSAPTKSCCQRVFASFKLFLHVLEDEFKMHTLAKMMTTPCSSLIVASISLLKTYFHHNFDSKDKIVTCFELFCPLLFKYESSLYINPSFPGKTISDPELLFDRFDVVMQSLNFFYYLLIRDEKNRVVFYMLIYLVESMGLSKSFGSLSELSRCH